MLTLLTHASVRLVRFTKSLNLALFTRFYGFVNLGEEVILELRVNNPNSQVRSCKIWVLKISGFVSSSLGDMGLE